MLYHSNEYEATSDGLAVIARRAPRGRLHGLTRPSSARGTQG